MDNHYLVLDIGGTAIKHAVMDQEARILAHGEVPTPDRDVAGVPELLEALDGIVAADGDGAEGIAVSMPGMIDTRAGIARTAGHITYLSGVPVRSVLEERYGLPCTVANDGNCAVVSESWRGSLEGCRNAAVVGLGTAVAGGLVLNGRLYEGSTFSAGEFSHVAADWRGAWEQKDAYWGHVGGVGGLCHAVARRTGEDPATLDGRIVFERANAGDEDALAGLREYCDYTAVQLQNLDMLLDLERIAIGGGISRQPLLIEGLRKAVGRLVAASPMRHHNPTLPVPTIVACKFFNEANLIGALRLHLLAHGTAPDHMEA
jgi:predicted NBD/HSP70 family sugar kinase